jgi:hypothetical protein
MRTPTAMSLIALSTLLPHPLQAQETQTSDFCTPALASAQKRIDAINNVSVLLNVADNIPQIYSNYPANRPYRYTFAVDGTAAESVMKSEKFLKSIAASVISNCSSVSMVIFAVYQTDWYYSYGLLPSGKIENFATNCVEAKPGKLRWGQQTCF